MAPTVDSQEAVEATTPMRRPIEVESDTRALKKLRASSIPRLKIKGPVMPLEYPSNKSIFEANHDELLREGSIELVGTATSFDLSGLRNEIVKSPYMISSSDIVVQARAGPVRHYTMSEVGAMGSYIGFEPNACIKFRLDNIKIERALGHYALQFSDLKVDMVMLLDLVDKFAQQSAIAAAGFTPAHHVWDLLDRESKFCAAVQKGAPIREPETGFMVMPTAEALKNMVGRYCTATFVLTSFTWKHTPEPDRRAASTKIKFVELDLN